MEEVGRLAKALFINDSKATNADSAAKRFPPSPASSGSSAASRRRAG
jgi:hypothetical protein